MSSYGHPLGQRYTVYPKKYAYGFVVLCFVVVVQSFIMNSHEVFIHIHQGWFAGTGAIVRLPQCQWSKPDGYGKISRCITTTKHSKAKTVCIFLGIYCKVKWAMCHYSCDRTYTWTHYTVHLYSLSIRVSPCLYLHSPINVTQTATNITRPISDLDQGYTQQNCSFIKRSPKLYASACLHWRPLSYV